MNEYYDHLIRVQNYRCNDDHDLLAMAGLMGMAGKIKHLAKYAKIAQDTEALDYCLSNMDKYNL